MERTPEQIAVIEKAKEAIREQFIIDGPYSHNIVGCHLRIVQEKVNTEAANELVDLFGLDEAFGIHKVAV